jgi:hypothetical protein
MEIFSIHKTEDENESLLTCLRGQSALVCSPGKSSIVLFHSCRTLVFSQNTEFYRKLYRHTLENSKVQPIQRFVRRMENYPILKTLLFLITTWKFGGVGALEACGGRQRKCAWHPYQIFPQNEKSQCFWRKIMESHNFFAKYTERIPQKI